MPLGSAATNFFTSAEEHNASGGLRHGRAPARKRGGFTQETSFNLVGR